MVSVIIPVYNVGRYLPRCLDSVLNQSFAELEIILVDDGSTDDSGKICESFAQRDGRIRVIHKENGGLSDARNEGINASSGEFVSFIDSDDFVHRDFIQSLYLLLHEKRADIAICGYVRGREVSFPQNKRGRKKETVLTSTQMLEGWHGEYKPIETVAWNKLYRKSLFTDNAIRYPVGFYNEDVQTTHLLVAASDRIALTTEKLYYYYQRENSIIQTVSAKSVEDSLYSQQVRLEYFDRQGYREAYERLQIKYQKYFMLAYAKLKKRNMEEVRESLLALYQSNYEMVIQHKQIHLAEKLLFRLFNTFYKIL